MQTTTPLHPDTQAVDEDFVMTNYSQLEPLVRRRMRELRLKGVAARLDYSSEDVDEEMQMECLPRFQLQPQINTENQGTQNKLPFLVAHLRDTERRQKTLSPAQAPIIQGGPTDKGLHSYHRPSRHQQPNTLGFKEGGPRLLLARLRRGDEDGKVGNTNNMSNVSQPRGY
ncbi:hypothetical protein Tco_0188704 [Tanacetum coccineum]